MTTKNVVEKEQKQTQNKQSLKGTLAEVLSRGGQPPANTPQPKQQNPAPEPPRASVPAPVPAVPEEKKPFEVSEDALRKVFKGET